jgi:hypothetical protein
MQWVLLSYGKWKESRPGSAVGSFFEVGSEHADETSMFRLAEAGQVQFVIRFLSGSDNVCLGAVGK